MIKQFLMLVGALTIMPVSAINYRIHPIVTTNGGMVYQVDTDEVIAWNPQAPDINVIHAAAIHIASQQCPDGGFGWPHNDCTTTYHNITSPILNGIHGAWQQTGNSAYLGIMVNGGNFDLLSQYSNGESRFSTETPLFMWNLSQASADTTYTSFVETDFFSQLDAVTYGPDDLGTSTWINSVVAYRQGTWINLLPWEFKSLPMMAIKHGRYPQAELYVQAILDGFNGMDDTSPDTVYSDLIGVAGGLWGLSVINRQNFPAINSPLHTINSLTSIQQLADFLVSKQNADGSWYWHSNLATPAENDKDVQTTAYAIMALIKVNQRLPVDYLPAINLGQNWLESMQDQFGGFPSFPGGVENTEVEAEALSALSYQVIEYSELMFDDGFE